MISRKILSYLLFFVLLIFINILSNIFNFNIDLTNDKKHSLSKRSIELISNLDDIIFIKVYLDGEFPAEFKQLKSELKNLLIRFKSIGLDNFEFEFINPNKSHLDEENNAIFRDLVNNGLYPTDIELRSSSSRSSQIIFPGALVYYKNNKVAVNFLKNSVNKKAGENINNSIENLEFEFISAIHQLTNKNIYKIAFLTGNGELIFNEVYDLINSVLKDNNNLDFYYKVDRFNIKEFKIDSATLQANISDQIIKLSKYKLLIVAKPTISFNMLEKFIIDQYVMNGGKILWLIDGVNCSMDSLQNQKSFIATKNELNIDDQLFKYGVRVNANLIEDLRSTNIPIITGYSNNVPQQSFFPWPYYPLLKSTTDHPIVNGLDAIKCNFVSSIDTINNAIKKTVLLASSKQSRYIPVPAKISLGILENPPPVETFNKAYLPIAVLLEGEFESVFTNRILPKQKSIDFKTKSKPTKMIVVSDGDIARNSISKDNNIYPLGYDKYSRYTYSGNKIFLMNAVHYLCDNTYLAKLKSKKITLRLLDREKILKYEFLIQIINIIIPLFFILSFTLIFLRIKKHKYE